MDSLSNLEKEIVILVAKGYSNREIAEKLRLAKQTVRNYLSIIYEKLGVHNRVALSNLAHERGWVQKDDNDLEK
ncbi:MAG: response regulator transcription factor [Chloroflexota bacterium]|nr:MAG: response regulator transcription factor [Chloroflexota bacterium]